MRLLIYLVCVFSMHLTSAQTTGDIILWNKDIKLSWTDFHALPSKTSKYAANSHCGIKIDFNEKTNVVEIIVESQFTRSKSWNKPGLRSDNLLRHEQGHFDMTELFARKLRKKISNLNISSKKDVDRFSRKVNELFNATYEKFQRESVKYDEKTNHSENIKEQEEWTEDIQEDLDSMEEYTNTKVSLTISE